MDNRTTWLLLGLGAAVGLWAISRTKVGTAAIQAAASATATATSSAATAIVSAATAGGAWIMSQVRGIRNNNPGNIRRTGDVWVGEAPDQSTDASFVVFAAPQYGIRALARILRNYYDSGQTTVRAMITRWAPPSENDTEAYIAAVTADSGLSSDDPIGDIELALPLLIPAIINHENGVQPYPSDTIALGIQLERIA